MRQTRRHRGFLLIIAVVLIPLVGLAVLITTAQTAQLSRTLRMAERRAEHKTLLFSAAAWLRANRSTVLALEAGQTIAVPMKDIAPHSTVCIAEVSERRGDSTALVLTLTIEELRTTRTITQRFILTATDRPSQASPIGLSAAAVSASP